jgi:hypothetical protein
MGRGFRQSPVKGLIAGAGSEIASDDKVELSFSLDFNRRIRRLTISLKKNIALLKRKN